ncbi:MAG: bi-domain-containing oxidoreductase [Planctomycetes bacterium]|nr:bi-domain-containing oxidoreductase [Planctomycetota bacterium]
MKQVIQDFKTGELFVDDVPIPSLTSGFVLVRNHYSLISAGTERSTVSTAKASLLGKARQRPDLVKQVLDTYKKEGFAETLKRVRTKLETLKELGYSSAGTVLLSMDTEGTFKPGDRVACGGSSASHAGIVSVPQNLVVKVPESVPLDHAAFTTLGSIAMQGVRQANPRIGEYVCVIGLGLLGQITAQILRSNGCRVFGIDTSSAMVKLGTTISCHATAARGDANLDSAIEFFTEGHGFDSVIITAAAKTSDPVELATAILRQKGVIVIVGAVPMNIPREPHFYKKELELKISCSYGPGRYDHTYEEEGHDYPYGHVRWTENRNMAAFVKLLESGSVDVKPLITHVFDIDQAEKAYDIVTGKVQEPSIGILLKYPETEEKKSTTIVPPATSPDPSVGIGFIGAGSFAQKFLIPNAQPHGALLTVADSRGMTAKSVGEKFKFRSFSANAHDVISDQAINTVFIATRHNTHGELVMAGIEADKNVYVEKPLTIYEADLPHIAEVCRRHPARRLQVGFNRRFSPLARQAKATFEGLSEPLLVNYRVSAGFLPKDHWTQTEEGGGRILGEVCHFVDFIQFMTGANPQKVFAECVSNVNSKTKDQDNVAITVSFGDGSIGLITYLACGDRLLAKERIEIFGGGKSFIINDFRTADIYLNGKCKKIKDPGKGHKEEVELFVKSIRDGQPSPIPLESILYTTATAFRILDSLRTGLPQSIDIP